VLATVFGVPAGTFGSIPPMIKPVTTARKPT